MFRTPVKTNLNATMTLSPGDNKAKSKSPLSERESIGEWENKTADAGRSNVTPPKKSQETIPLPLKKIPARKLSAERARSPPKPTAKNPPDTITEARNLHNKIKQYMRESKNIKGEIKTGVLDATERLYQIVKELGLEQNNLNRKRETIPQIPKEMEKEKYEECGDKNKEEKRLKQDKTLESMESMIRDQTELIKQNNKKLEHLSKIIEEKEIKNIEKQTTIPVPPKKALHSIIVSSPDEMNTGDDIMIKLSKRANEDEGWIKVGKVRKAKDRKVIIGYNTEEERRKAKERIQETEKELIVEEVKNKDPLLVAYGVLKIHKDEEVLKAIRTNNKEIFHDLNKTDDRMEVKYKKRARNPHTHHVVLKVSPVIWKRAIEKGTLHIDIQPIKVADQSPLVQCTQCLGYGHSKKFCKEAEPSCSHCGGFHLSVECEDRMAGTTPCCRNCRKANLVNVEHNAFNKDCPIMKKWDNIARQAVQYHC